MDSNSIFKILKKSFDILLRDILPLIVAGLICGVLSALTLGVLGGPLVAGLYRMVFFRLRDGRAPEISDVFYFERFGTFVLAFYGLGALVSIGFMLFIVPGLYLLTIWLYVFPLMVQRDMTLSDAMAESKAIVDRAGLGQQFALVLVLSLLGVALCTLTKGLGYLVFAPYAVIYTFVALENLSSSELAPIEPASEEA